MLRLLRSALLMASIATAITASQDQPAADQLIFGKQGGTADIKSFDKPALSDLLTIEPSVSVFYDYVRQSETLVSQATAPCDIAAARSPNIRTYVDRCCFRLIPRSSD